MQLLAAPPFVFRGTLRALYALSLSLSLSLCLCLPLCLSGYVSLFVFVSDSLSLLHHVTLSLSHSRSLVFCGTLGALYETLNPKPQTLNPKP